MGGHQQYIYASPNEDIRLAHEEEKTKRLLRLKKVVCSSNHHNNSQG